MRVLFLYLTAFTSTGGIEKFNKGFMKALGEIANSSSSVFPQASPIIFKAFSLYDNTPDTRYIQLGFFKGFNGSKLKFVLESIKEALKSDLIILGHINLSPIGSAIKKLRNKIKIFLVTHGIEVWVELPKLKKQILLNSDKIFSVSNFTKQKLISIHKIPADKIRILPDTLDPYFEIRGDTKKPEYLLKRYGITENTKVMLTVSRLSYTERYKGYDKVIQSLPQIFKEINPSSSLKYIIVGKSDPDELRRIQKLIALLNLEEFVVLTGYVPDEELIDHYFLADVFIMPSRGEGFGIVLIEALACGKPVIAGDKDGSVDAVLNGELGVLVDPDDTGQIKDAVVRVLKRDVPEKLLDGEYLRKRVLEVYGFDKFKEKVKISIEGIIQ